MGTEKAPYVTAEDWGDCKACGKHDDRRYGVCFDCADLVVTDGSFAWVDTEPEHKWKVRGTHVSESVN